MSSLTLIIDGVYSFYFYLIIAIPLMSSIYSKYLFHGPGDVVVDVNHQVSLPPQVEFPHSVELPQPSYQVELPLQGRRRFRD